MNLSERFTQPCPYCLQQAPLVDSIAVYSRSYGMIYLCTACDAYVGVHKHSSIYEPLGTLANAVTREARKKAHAAFDPMWKNARDKCDARQAAYKILAEVMNLKASQAHIGLFNVVQCNRLRYRIRDIKAFD